MIVFYHKMKERDEKIVVPGDTETSRTIIVRLSVATHKALRIRVAESDTSIQKWVENLIEHELQLASAPTASMDKSKKEN